jgi:hypothetical protein
MVRVQTSVGKASGKHLVSKQPSVGIIPKKMICMCHLAQLVER